MSETMLKAIGTALNTYNIKNRLERTSANVSLLVIGSGRTAGDTVIMDYDKGKMLFVDWRGDPFAEASPKFTECHPEDPQFIKRIVQLIKAEP